jgi:adenylate cyclase
MIFLSGIFIYLLSSLSLYNVDQMDSGLYPEIRKRHIEQIVVVSGMCFFYITVAAILLTKSIMAPIRELATSMKKVSEGKIGAKSSIISTDEIGGLSKGFNLMTDGLVERDNIKRLFGHYVSSEIRDSILEGKFEQEGKEVEATILFSDIRNFTELSEKIPPAKVVELLNQYFTEMVTAITNHGGVIDKFIGDAIMAIFGAPRGIGNHGLHAIHAGVEMLKRLEAHNELQRIKKEPEFKIGIGINSGPLIMGNIGSEKRREFTVIGDTVNIASRLESATKVYRKNILFSESTQKLAGIGEYLHRVRLKGKSEKIKIYTIKL